MIYSINLNTPTEGVEVCTIYKKKDALQIFDSYVAKHLKENRKYYKMMDKCADSEYPRKACFLSLIAITDDGEDITTIKDGDYFHIDAII